VAQDLSALLQEYGGLLAHIASSYEADAALRQDLLQDITLALWRAIPSCRNGASMKMFVARVAHNRGASHVVNRMRHPKTVDLIEELPDATEGPETHTQLQQNLVRLQNAVRSLPLNLRQTVTLAFEGFSHQEIGDTLGISANNVDVRLNRARKALKTALGEST